MNLSENSLKHAILTCSLIFLFGCSVHDYRTVTRAALSSDPTVAAKSFAKKKASYYEKNPQALLKDTQNFQINFKQVFEAFLGEISKKWGKKESKSASQKVYVKYTDSYKSRALVDFEKGEITVETIDSQAPKESLRKAIVTTLLTPENPEGVDLYSDKEVSFQGKPYLAGLVKDHEQKVVLYEWRAGRYADYLINNQLKTRTADKQMVHYVHFHMTREYNRVKSAKYGDIVKKYARLYGIDEALILAIIKSESSFNPYAVSSIPAYGLMQVVPQSAGRDAHRELYRRDGVPTRSQLFDPDTNVRYGTMYLKILYTRYLAGIRNPQSLEYCVIAAYNTGSGNVLRTFDRNRVNAIKQINAQPPQEVYRRLRTSLPYEETRNYVRKVTEAKRDFIVHPRS